MIDENGEEVYKTKYIIEVQRKCYENLYNEVIEIDDTPIEYITGNYSNKPNDEEAQTLEDEQTYKELTDALKNMKPPTGPGNDGFSADLF